MRQKLTACPYCGKRLKYTQAWSIRKQEVYTCKKCEKTSTTNLKQSAKKAATGAVSISFLIVALSFAFIRNCTFWTTILVIIPFITFYAALPLFIMLTKKKP